ncbi:MAG: hypothetical protein HY332_10465 [Chloroflexi bacterium]|nr:hypothetical protein [Chloroflexota bacterium]
MFDEIVAALSRHSGVSDWTVRRRVSHGVQLYAIGREIESLRAVTTETYDLDVFNDHPFPRGDAAPTVGGLPVTPADESGAPAPAIARGVAGIPLALADRGRLQHRIDDAVLMASLVHNPPYALPEPAAYPDVPLEDPSLSPAPAMERAARDFADQLWGLVDREAGVCLSAAELFLRRTEIELRNSRGIHATAATTRVMTEFVLLAGGEGSEEAEHFRQIEVRRIGDLRLSESVAEAANFARDTLRAETPKTRTGAVVLTGDALAPLFDAFTFQASASAAYNKFARFEVGQNVSGNRPLAGDPLTLHSNALRPYGLDSHRFDGDGVPGRDVLLIERGVLRARHATQRYAQYLGIPVTGEPGNTEVEPGTAALADLLRGDGPVYHVVGFSASDVDPITGDFGSEIRLGYEITPQGVRPIKGGSVSGNVFAAFADARFSAEVLERGAYRGPSAIRFAALRVSGEA